METEVNGNCANSKKSSVAASSSVEDLSEYTDADESISAPTEILAEFLSAVMLKDYETALKYCKMILQYEPNHATAKEFYPLILEKIIQASAEAENKEVDTTDSTGESESNDDDDEEEVEEVEEEEEASEESESSEGTSESIEDEEEKPPSDSDATTASYSSLEDEEADTNTINTNNCYIQMQQQAQLQQKQNDNEYNPENGNKEINSDSESPTEPVSQMLITAKLRSLVLPNK
ncbi:uncharacterized protein LOC142330084 [Lycorma delicatula]|uniref:uncharacterized protein LOC142330084 n=1 Tax=Lycorma delicatula TaxID=130591 RepID=UPI003F50F0D5